MWVHNAYRADNGGKYRNLEYIEKVLSRAAGRARNKTLAEGLEGIKAGRRAEQIFESYALQMQKRVMAANSPYRITTQPAALISSGARVLARTKTSFSGRWTAGAKRLEDGIYSIFEGKANTARILSGGDFTVTPNGATKIPSEYAQAFPGVTIFGIDPKT